MPNISPPVAISQDTLADLAARIRAGHEATRACVRNTFNHALKTGELLLEAKAQVAHGAWGAWVREQCDLSERSAQGYMQLARNPEAVEAIKSATVADLAIRQTLKSLAKPSKGGVQQHIGPDSKSETERLRARWEEIKAELANQTTTHNAVAVATTVPAAPPPTQRQHKPSRNDGPTERSDDKPRAKATFNKTNEHVSWAAWTWNPVTGCLHGCKYCYAREIANRFYVEKFAPTFHPERLDAPRHTAVPKDAAQDSRLGRVFVCSMADLYGKWVPSEWIERVHASCIDNPQWEYLLLTKFPRRYVELQLPPTAWIGTSVDEQKRVRLAEDAFRELKRTNAGRVRWLSLEPLLAPLEFTDLSMFDWVVIGAQSATLQPDSVGRVPEFAPPFDWVARLVAQAREAGCRVYLKPNLMGRDPHNPGMTLPQEQPRILDTAPAAPAAPASAPAPQAPQQPSAPAGETIGPLDLRETERPGIANYLRRAREARS